MEYLQHDTKTVTIRIDKDEIIELLQVLTSVIQEYDGLDVEILNLSHDELRALKQKVLSVLDQYARGPA